MKRSYNGKRNGSKGCHIHSKRKYAKRQNNTETITIPRGYLNRPVDEEDVAEFMLMLQQRRFICAKSVSDIAFRTKRMRVLSSQADVPDDCNGPVLYWMSRDMRVQDNWAFLYAQRIALKFELPLISCYCLAMPVASQTLRHYDFIIRGLREVEYECNHLNIGFHLLRSNDKQELIQFIKDQNISVIICDFSPLRPANEWLNYVRNNLPVTIPLLQLDARNIVPVWIASSKQEYSARTIRKKINWHLHQFLTEFPPLIKHNYPVQQHQQEQEQKEQEQQQQQQQQPLNVHDWSDIMNSVVCDQSVNVVPDFHGGYTAACRQLFKFCKSRLKFYSKKRNDASIDCLSGLSPWLHFGQISAQRCVLEIQRYEIYYKDSVAKFCEEIIIRRELSENFCFYNPNFDKLSGLQDWAQQTLNKHRSDPRSPIYSLEELENAETHNDLWNAAQLQLVKDGKMHGYLRMYWAKKILQWCETPEEALEYALQLNDKYSLDGSDSNGYAGCLWSLGGLHDQGWAERPIFGKIRYMNYDGCKRKFDVDEFVERYDAKIYTKICTQTK